MSSNKQRKIGECYECGVQGQLINMYSTLQGDSVNLTFRHGPSKTCEYREHDFTILGKAMEYEFQEVEGEEKTNLDLFIAQYNNLQKQYNEILSSKLPTMQLVKENENYIGNDNIIELIKKEVAIADKLKNIINEISIEYRSTGEIIIRLYKPKDIVDP